MDRWLQVFLVVAVLILVGFLVPLIIQLQRTARAMEGLAESAREDLRRISDDVHGTRLEVERVGALLEKGLEFPAAASSLAAALTHTLTRSVSPWLEAAVTGLKIALDFFMRPGRAHSGKEKNDE